ncbi:MAG: ribosomal protein S18-alanine N-acetyltransferase [Fibrobacteres bacterium]|nr:ribosomal protein S18-alanine N-acetyltransferase [Fibrobacterota bacterium]
MKSEKFDIVKLSPEMDESIFALETAVFEEPWTKKNIEDEFSHGELYGINEGVRVVAYIALRITLDEAELLRIGVLKEFRRLGLGRKMVDFAFESLRNKGCKSIFLEVKASNEKAISLYSASGFAISGRRPRYYRNGEDAILMQKVL